MSDALKHECGFSVVRLLKPLAYYKEKYGIDNYLINKMYLLLQKQHNRGQDGAGLGVINSQPEAGASYIYRTRSNKSQPIRDIFKDIADRQHLSTYDQKPFYGDIALGHLRYSTFGNDDIENVHPLIRQAEAVGRTIMLAGNFNLTNTPALKEQLMKYGLHPVGMSDTKTILDQVGYFWDQHLASLGGPHMLTAPSQELLSQTCIEEVLKSASSNWDGGYVIAGVFGHGDLFVYRDPKGIRTAFYYKDDEILAVASERVAIQTALGLPVGMVKEIFPGQILIMKKDMSFSNLEVFPPSSSVTACSFERIYFSRGNDQDIYKERKALGREVYPKLDKIIGQDFRNIVFSYIPNTSEVSHLGLLEQANKVLSDKKVKMVAQFDTRDQTNLEQILSESIRVEKIAIKDIKLRTFIARDEGREDLASYVYDVTYGVIKSTDTLVVIDDSIVRGTTLRTAILKSLYKIKPKRIVVVSSAPQVRYPDCYGIDMSRFDTLVAFQAAVKLLEEQGKNHILEEVYRDCCLQSKGELDPSVNHVKRIYEPFTEERISKKISCLLGDANSSIPLDIVFQDVEGLERSIPSHKGGWYFTGNYPTLGGIVFVRQAYINYFEGNGNRAYG